MKSQNNTKRIALITTWYPPINGIAVNRMNAFVNYLSEEFQLEVFCLGEENKTIKKSENILIHYSTSNKIFDPLKSKPTDKKWIHNTKTVLRILTKYVIKNPMSKWLKMTTNQLIKRHQDNKFDLIMSSFSPAEAHLVAINFKRLFSGVHWIADMRDEMSSNPYIDSATKNRLRELEKMTNQYASAILSVSKPILDQFAIICPNVSHFLEIRNGFDHSLTFKGKSEQTEVFSLGYFGSFYGARKPDFLFEALVKIQNERPEIHFCIYIYGAHNNYLIPPTLKNHIVKYSGLSYEEAIKKMHDMDATILIHPRSEQKGIFSGKIFDYISASTPVLAFVDTEDVAANLIKEMNAGYVAEFNSVDENKKIILQAIEDKKNKIYRVASKENIQLLHRKNQIVKLASLIKNLIEK
jgi:glycosyltransferase involved in cell wall biosynthesis